LKDTHFTITTSTGAINIPKYVVISFLTIFAIGPQYFLNLSFTLNQIVVQNGFTASSYDMLFPSILSNLAFAFGVPLGPALSRKFGLRSTYLTLVWLFLFGSIINLASSDLSLFDTGRIIQGLSSGMLFLTILPASLRSFPNKIRNTFLIMAIAGLFGSSAVGAYFGSISLRLDAWRWLFILNIFSSLLCLIVGYALLPKNQPAEHPDKHFDKKGVGLLLLLVITLAIPLIHLQKSGFRSELVWPYFIGALAILSLFIYLDSYAKNPLVPFRSLFAAKPFFGLIMAIVSHVALIVALAGMNGFLRNIQDTAFVYLSHFYIWLFVGILAAAIFSTLLYDKLGAGILGIIGSLAIIVVSYQWRTIGEETSLPVLYTQFAFMGGGISITLVSGALGTALAGDIHKASLRSVSLHFTRNLIGAIVAPVIGWFLYMRTAVHYEHIREQVSLANPEVTTQLDEMVRKFVGNGLPISEAKNMVTALLATNAQKTALNGSFHDLFTMLLWLGIIILIASIGKWATGKGRSLVQKEKPTMLLVTPKEDKQTIAKP
jgi:MFS transporter, DHA2 family, multidrug resistance protein